MTAIIIPIKGEMKKDARINGEESVSKPIAAIPEAAHSPLSALLPEKQ